MIQEIAVTIILAAVMIYVGYNIHKSLKGRGKSPCDDCEGCILKKQLKDAKIDCKDKGKKRR
jgi:hypothetical protein